MDEGRSQLETLALAGSKPSWTRPVSEPLGPVARRHPGWRVKARSPLSRVTQEQSSAEAFAEEHEQALDGGHGLPPLSKAAPCSSFHTHTETSFFSADLLPSPSESSRPQVLSAEVLRLNSQLEKTLRTALQPPQSAIAHAADQGMQGPVRASRCLSEMHADLEALHANVTDVQGRHLDFLAIQEVAAEAQEISRQAERRTTYYGKKMSMQPRATLKVLPVAEEPIKSRRASSEDRMHADGAPSPDFQRQTVVRMDHAAAAVAVLSKEHSKTRPVPKGMQQTVLTRAQEFAMSKFEDIDDGKVGLSEVFEKIPNNARRVVTKLEYYRERADLVLPRIEEGFMRDDRGSPVVDVLKLRSKQTLTAGSFSARGPVRDAGPVTSHGAQTARAGLNTSGQIGLPHITEGQKGDDSSDENSDAPFSFTLSPSCSMESFQQKSQRLAQMGHRRDMRIASARSTERSQHLARRVAHLTGLQCKDARKQIATRDRMIFVWVVLAIATDTMVNVWRSFVHAYDDIKSQSSMQVLVREGTQSIISNIHHEKGWEVALGTLRASKLMLPHTRLLVMSGLQGKFSREVQAQCSKHAYLSWCHLLRVSRFIAIMYRKRRLNRYAEIIKEIINASWRGYRMVASMKVYLQQMNFLQRALRNCVVLRRHVKQFILMPTLWEVETMILGEISMPPQALAHEIEMHRNYWDYKQRMAEVRHLANQRTEWSKYRHAKLALGDRVQIYTERQNQFMKKRKTAAEFRGSSVAKKKMFEHEERRRQAIAFDKLSKAPDTCSSGTGISGLRARLSHPMMALIDKYRLSRELRNEIVSSILRENIERWWVRYQEYKSHCIVFSKMWHKWKLEVSALGSQNQSSWPPMPPIPRYPYELTKVDTKVLHSRVLAMLKQTEAGQLL